MNQALRDVEQVLKFDPKAKGRSDVTPSTTRGRLCCADPNGRRSREPDAIVPCRWPTNFRWSFERRKIERIGYWWKWSFKQPRSSRRGMASNIRKRSRTSSSFGDRYPASKKRYFTARSRVAKGCIVVS
jgi:hypothetical protein